MSETSLNAKCKIEGFSPFKIVIAQDIGYWSRFLHKFP